MIISNNYFDYKIEIIYDDYISILNLNVLPLLLLLFFVCLIIMMTFYIYFIIILFFISLLLLGHLRLFFILFY